VSEPSEVSIVFVTAAQEEEAAAIGRTVVLERLAACASILPRITSVYWWKGELCEEQEYLVILKTRSALFNALQARIRALHSYETPEIVAFPVAQGFEDYLRWVVKETGRR
jgi:periplasmic divalent cation tolerance protein